MTNPHAAIRLLITYAICIPLAITVGYLLTNPLDYGTIGFLGLILALIISPVFIKWHYPIMIFGIGCPMSCFFLVGNPPLWQVVALLSFAIAVVERAVSPNRRFISPPSMVWPLVFLTALVILTAKLTGGIGLHSVGGGGGGGKKYISIFCGIAMFFAISSRTIPKEQRRLYIALFFLAGTPSFISDLFPYLPSPLNYINLLFPPSVTELGTMGTRVIRLGALAGTAGVIANFMLARFGLRGILDATRPWRAPFFVLLMVVTTLGGFRSSLITYVLMVGILFFMEGLHRTRLLLVVLLGGLLAAGLVVPFSKQLPLSMQRTMSFLPLPWDTEVKLQANASSEWRFRIWHDVWPQVPQYLLLGKGYSLTAEDFSMMGSGEFANTGAAKLDASQEALAISGDYHSGPLSTLVPFGIWGAIGIVWLQLAGLRIVLRNYRYGDPALKTVNAFLLVYFCIRVFGFYFIFGAFSNDVGEFAKTVAFSAALNWGVAAPAPAPVALPRIKPLPAGAVAQGVGG